ncbi:MAG: GAF domain-containing protein [Phormidesmis sp.]
MTYGTSSAAEPIAGEDNLIQTQLSCFLEGLSPAQRDQNRAQTLAQLKLPGTDAIPVFDEAVQTVSRLLAMPICILSFIDADLQRFKSVVGLSSLGLMNQLAQARSIPRSESFCTHVIDSGQTFAIEDTTAHPAFSHSLLVQRYGIHSYLGVPLITTEGCCIGTLAIMDLLPHQFTQQEVAFLELSARWCMSEFQKQHLLTLLHQGNHPLQSIGTNAQTENSLLSKINQVRFDLIVQLTQDLRNPLTSITGMANMLSREIYGPLSEKQQEYTKIVLSSSQQLLVMVDEIVEVGALKEEGYQLSLAAADIEMIGQQALAALENLAKQQELKLKLTVEPGSRIWNLDKRIVKQLIYHLVFSIIRMSTAGSTIRLHVSRKDSNINIALWVSNPWLGEDLPQAVIAWGQRGFSQGSHNQSSLLSSSTANSGQLGETKEVFEALATAQKVDASRQELGLLLSRHLTDIHSGNAFVQGSAATGYRYIVSLPALNLPN